MDDKDIANRFNFHPANTAARSDAHAGVRVSCKQLADTLNRLLPESQEKLLAITYLEMVMFWSNAALARQAGD